MVLSQLCCLPVPKGQGLYAIWRFLPPPGTSTSCWVKYDAFAWCQHPCHAASPRVALRPSLSQRFNQGLERTRVLSRGLGTRIPTLALVCVRRGFHCGRS